MKNKPTIALITRNKAVAKSITDAFEGMFYINVYTNGIDLHNAILNHHVPQAIIADDELKGANGTALRHTLISFGHGRIPFMLLLNTINNTQRKLAMIGGITDIFSKPLNTTAIQLRVQYLIENHLASFANTPTVQHKKMPFSKRLFDIIFSGMALLLLSPLFFIIAVLVKLGSAGPVFYYSLRVGAGYKIFKFYKFRSMVFGADAKLESLSHLNQYNSAKKSIPVAASVKQLCASCIKSGSGCINALYADNKIICENLYKHQKGSNTSAAFIKIKDDPRITRIGNFIRNTSIDELPQLWNVLIGDMSIIGNRPLPIYEADKITTDKYAERFIAPAGITGLWQVEKRGGGEMSEEERLNLDNKYARTHSLLNDAKLLIRTIPALFQSANV